MHTSEFWSVLPLVVHEQNKPWLVGALPSVLIGKHRIALINLEFQHLRQYYFSLAGLEFELDQKSADWKEFCKQIQTLIQLPQEINGKREKWTIKIKNGKFGKITYETVPRLFVGDQCCHLDCTGKITHRGRLAPEQWSEEQEVQEARGEWTSARISAYRYYCDSHTKCRVDYQCKGPLSMITTTLYDTQSGSQLDGALFCVKHAPAGPKHLLFNKL